MADSNPSDFIRELLEREPETTICFCNNVSLGKLLEAIRNGADTLEKIKDVTRASTGCGGCEPEVIEILEAVTKK